MIMPLNFFKDIGAHCAKSWTHQNVLAVSMNQAQKQLFNKSAEIAPIFYSMF